MLNREALSFLDGRCRRVLGRAGALMAAVPTALAVNTAFAALAPAAASAAATACTLNCAAISGSISVPISGTQTSVQAYVFDSSMNYVEVEAPGSTYTTGALNAGIYYVCFVPVTGQYWYVQQCYNGAVSLQTAAPVTTSAGQTTVNVNATMVQGGRFTGTVTDAATGNPLSNVTVTVLGGAASDMR